MVKRYLNVSYRDRDMAKRLGARWDPAVKRWYCPPGSALAKVYAWRKDSLAHDVPSVVSAPGLDAAVNDAVPPPAYDQNFELPLSSYG